MTDSYLDGHSRFVRVWQAVHRSSVAQAKADWPGHLRFAHTLSSFPPAVIDATTKADQLYPAPFTARGLRLLRGTQAFLVKAKLAARSFPIGDWIAPGAKG